MLAYECPICHTRVNCERPEDAPYRPFCSSRCKLIDLGRWLNEEYRVSEQAPELPEAEMGEGPDPGLPDESPEGEGI